MEFNDSKYKTVGIESIENILNKSEIQTGIYQLLENMKNKGNIIIPQNAKVMIKPNICLVKRYDTGATVDPFIVKCIVDWLLKHYEIEKIYIGEADATALNADIAFKVLGWEELFKKYSNVELLNLSNDELVNIELDGLYFKNLKMSKAYMESDFLISVGKLKTHTMTGITGILKNQFGANPVKYKLKYHSSLDKVITDLNKVKKPDLCIVDGIIAMDGEGPVLGTPKPVGIIIAGNDIVATDYACARIMGFNPNRISHLNLALKQGLGSNKYTVIGEKIENVQTKFKVISPWKKLITNLYMSKSINKIPLWKNILKGIFRA